MDEKSPAQTSVALEECIEKYIEERRRRVKGFVECHFSFQETIELQKKSVFIDLLLNPLNAAWSLPYLFAKKVFETLEKFGWNKLNPYFAQVPTGIRTHYQREIERLITDELLEWSKEAAPQKNAFLAEMKKYPALLHLIESAAFSRSNLTGTLEFQESIALHSASRAMISDVAGSLLTLLAGWLYAGDYSLGVLGLGDRIASNLARDSGASNFFLGKGLGSAFYRIFPPQPSSAQIFLSTFVVGLVLTLFSLLASVLSDPLRKKTGLQEQKLHALLDDLEERLLLQLKRRFKHALKMENISS